MLPKRDRFLHGGLVPELAEAPFLQHNTECHKGFTGPYAQQVGTAGLAAEYRAEIWSGPIKMDTLG
ncbi:MAG: hypothetical protein QY319_03080 [Candidatus Kapaibacterium sp.]|nr:MAG: hypothetical protein QY319_03060 [Candidatus Kapabacteria bacterium]WKZ78409.1 MAG: hypothetical protein QY319_03080 [Candidatus Kapabacteria bacterium]